MGPELFVSMMCFSEAARHFKDSNIFQQAPLGNGVKPLLFFVHERTSKNPKKQATDLREPDSPEAQRMEDPEFEDSIRALLDKAVVFWSLDRWISDDIGIM